MEQQTKTQKTTDVVAVIAINGQKINKSSDFAPRFRLDFVELIEKTPSVVYYVEGRQKMAWLERQ